MMRTQRKVKQSIRNAIYHLPLVRGVLTRLGELERQVSDLSQQLATLQIQIKELEQGIKWRRKVELIDFGVFSLFMFTGDAPHQRALKGEYSIQAQLLEAWHEENREVRVTTGDRVNKANVFFILFEHYWEQSLPFVFIDIGCAYGMFLLSVASYIKKRGRRNDVIGLDPGVAGTLVPFTIALNKLEDIVTFEPLAVSNRSSPSIIFTEMYHSENNRLVNRMPVTEYESYVVNAVTIDDYLASNNLEENPIIKIDTQGAEYEIFQGMRKTMINSYLTCFTEFTPHALRSRIDPVSFLKMCGDSSYLIDFPEKNRMIKEIHSRDYADFAREVAQREEGYTDILLIPKKLPGSDTLRKRFLAVVGNVQRVG